MIVLVFHEGGAGGGILFLFLCGITCYLYYIYYSFMNCTALVAVLSSSVEHPLSSSAPQPGYEYVKIGNIHATSASRQGSIYLT